MDTTVCIGCRQCEWACKDAHGLPAGDLDSYDDRSVFQRKRRPDGESLTVVNAYLENAGRRFTKFQCMHCIQPACKSACIVGAFSKSNTGAVLWDTDKCIGCRYCMVACPFQIPVFQYDRALRPDIMKCDFCAHRERPACVEICPVEALTYGPRSELIRLAHERIRKHPQRYGPHVYGEHEVGGTAWMYLAAAEFSSIGLPNLPAQPAPGVTESIQHGIFAYFIPPVLLYALLGGMMWLRKNKRTNDDHTSTHSD